MFLSFFLSPHKSSGTRNKRLTKLRFSRELKASIIENSTKSCISHFTNLFDYEKILTKAGVDIICFFFLFFLFLFFRKHTKKLLHSLKTLSDAHNKCMEKYSTPLTIRKTKWSITRKKKLPANASKDSRQIKCLLTYVVRIK